jgi:hypothetical protein
MKNRKLHPKMLLGLLALTAFLLLTTGCSDEGSSPLETDLTGADDFASMDMSDDFGGLTASDEDEAFADDGLKAMMYAEDDEYSDDPLNDDPEVQSWEQYGDEPGDPSDPARPRFTFLRLRWGMVHGPLDTTEVGGFDWNPEDNPPLDWTGEIHTDRGLVVVRRVIAFERQHGDHLVRPRLNPQTVAFVSHTGPHFDGLVLEIIERPVDLSEELPANKLHINTGPFQGEYLVDELRGLDELNEVDAMGNVFQLTGYTLSDINYCPKGFLSGRYKVLPPAEVDPADGEDPDTMARQIGTFAGGYMELHGGIRGFLAGGYGLDENGNRVFFGKYIGRSGVFHGLIRGTWEPGDEDDAMGTFNGEWVGAGGNVEGYLRGVCHPVESAEGGFFEGRWTTACDNESEQQVF